MALSTSPSKHSQQAKWAGVLGHRQPPPVRGLCSWQIMHSACNWRVTTDSGSAAPGTQYTRAEPSPSGMA
eukprot:1183825-Prorocentrum_minimum.AAC.1